MKEILAAWRGLQADLRERNRLLREVRENEKLALDAMLKKLGVR